MNDMNDCEWLYIHILKGGEKMIKLSEGSFELTEDVKLCNDMKLLSGVLEVPLKTAILLEILLKLNKLTEQENKNEKADHCE